MTNEESQRMAEAGKLDLTAPATQGETTRETVDELAPQWKG